MFKAILKVLRSVREYKIFAIITPLFMIGEQRTITITVTDSADEPTAISGATVKLSRKTATTNASGEASFSSVGDGNHTVKVTAEGYEEYTGTKTTDSTHTTFTIQLTAVTTEEEST